MPPTSVRPEQGLSKRSASKARVEGPASCPSRRRFGFAQRLLRTNGLLVLLVGTSVAVPAPAQQPAAADYRKDSNWLCLPGRNDVCSTPLATTALNPNGYGSTGLSKVAANPPLDCFYVYPTVTRDPGANSDLSPGPEERGVVQVQFARLAEVCRPFVPVYRQMTMVSILAAAAGGDARAAGTLAYRDIAAAFSDFVRNRNPDRPFVLIGHSQGSFLLTQLIARQIENSPDRKRMRLAILAGWNILVPQGKLVGGSFRSTPLCSRPGERGCVIAWTSFRERNPPPRGAFFGYSARPGMTVACVNPARPGATGWQRLDSYWPAQSAAPAPGGPIIWSSEGRPPSPFLRTDGLTSGRCINDGARGYLSIRTNADPTDKRSDRVPGEVGAMGMFMPGWGMHLADIQLVLGDLLRRVEDVGTK